MPAAGFEPTNPATERQQTDSQDKAWDLGSVAGQWEQER